uniref:Dehydrogenase/reductase SDR family member 13-like n=1 Tax=Phallusia mammillata TaxID=59560 RepID=A0A6F9DA78_9ASCI|nr:dehydrogenase/reductase SDR family member 13-like [Phallusia mammillata]
MDITGKRIAICTAIVAMAYYWQMYIKRGPMCNCAKDMTGKTVLITGGSRGVGKVTAMDFAKMGATVVIASRNDKKLKETVAEIIEKTGNQNVRSMSLDLADFESVRSFAKKFNEEEKYLDILVNNAGVLGVQGVSAVGFSSVFTINHFGHFLLTNLLLDKMRGQSAQRPVRVINLTSEMYKAISAIDYDFIKQGTTGIIDAYQMYATSKLANILFTAEFNRRCQGDNIRTYAVNPGVLETEIEGNMPYNFDKINWYFLKLIRRPVEFGSQTILHCALTDIEDQSGNFFQDCHKENVWENAKNITEAKKLWDMSVEITGLK